MRPSICIANLSTIFVACFGHETCLKTLPVQKIITDFDYSFIYATQFNKITSHVILSTCTTIKSALLNGQQLALRNQRFPIRIRVLAEPSSLQQFPG